MPVEAEDIINATIAKRVRALRISRNIKVDDLAQTLRVKSHYVTRIENGNSTMTASQLVRMAQALGVRVSVVVGDIPANQEENAHV